MIFDILIANGTVVDGTGKPAFRGDIGIAGDRIVEIGNMYLASARTRIDAEGMIVSPGFIDMHTHSDLSLLDHPGGESKAYQGVTTEVTGNCSWTPFPAGKLGPKELRASLGSTLRSKVEWDWSTLDAWASRMETNGISLNVAPQVGQGGIRAAVNLKERRDPTPDEMKEMKYLLSEALEQGAFGMTTGLTVAPSMYASTDEIVELAKVMRSHYGAYYATHARLWPGGHVNAVREAVEVGKRAAVPVQYSHIAIIDRRMYGRGDEMTVVIDKARDEGLDITCDMYPYTAAGHGLSQILPDWVQEGGVPAMVKRLRDPQQRRRAAEETEHGTPDTEARDWLWPRIFIAEIGTGKNLKYVGMTIAQIAKERNVEPAEAVVALIEEEENNVRVVTHNRIETDVTYFLTYEQSMIGSDGNAVDPSGLMAISKPHPRFYGTYPRILGKYVRGEKVMTLEKAIYKMTGFPAKRLTLKDRGVIARGKVADVVVFNPSTITDMATFDDPQKYAVGVQHLLVNGTPVIANGKHTAIRAGKVLRRGKD
ncbi:MAG: D-aminoacylase [SAR202 cluster bacterium]|nr:D-aminoacylase [SAR202 cluster bacterium]